jgi:putative ATPase
VTTIRALQADITTLEVDAIVNAANIHLQHGGGIALAISRAGGPSIQRDSDRWISQHGPLQSGVAAVTGSGDLPCRFVIHVAGPIHSAGQDNESLLRAAVHGALQAAESQACRTVALPAISAGVFRYPVEEATAVIADAAVSWSAEHPGALDEVLLVGYDEATAQAFGRALGSL